MRILLVILFTCSTAALFAQEKVLYDSAAVATRTFKTESFDQYKTDTDFQYDRELVQTPSIIDRFWAWVWEKYEEIMSTEAGKTTMTILLWALGLGGLAFFIYKIVKMNRYALFTANERGHMPYKVESENIHAIQFDEAINEAVQQGNYRLAIRLSYLQNLKLLADRLLIDWRPNKTNTDYWKELDAVALRPAFRTITNIFEYAWYGSHSVTRDDFETMRTEIHQFKNQLQNIENK
ncbi:DUF4129 domain-containing protein [Panacibacter sp. DH6]|uniref:DUF4129 domain-containing protein n=1 Tax=Panacibacter microcysteis TaxID=2793269 RepID=A0A931GZ15_9BACT|nr:DUF4129 domain-containing protein [Panacibacter microcysteis]MBG9377971.1 DUF4129 domain-containing protein [Panacibacter microcysteis]